VIDVLVVDDHEMFSEALTLLLEQQSDVRLLGAAKDANEALRMCRERPPDVVLMDIDLPDVDGVEATQWIASMPPDEGHRDRRARDPAIVATAIAAGRATFRRTQAVEDLMEVVQRAAAGEFVMPEADLAPVLAELRAGREPPSGRLGCDASRRARPRSCARWPRAARCEIADATRDRRLTVQSHVKNILAKLGVHSRLEA
jgi:DNA-binding NarL/FixJ family response regulator